MTPSKVLPLAAIRTRACASFYESFRAFASRSGHRHYPHIPQINEMAGSASLTCTENIALFHLLHAGRGKDKVLSKDSVPARPSIAPAECLPTHRGDYVLSFERERSLAGALAYISNIKDDPNRVAAICVEEDHRPRGKPSLRILLAVNRSEYKDGDDFLQILEAGFKGIFAELSQVVDGCKLLFTDRILQSAAEYHDIQ